MASTVNNFSLLASGGDSASKSSKKKKPQSASTSDTLHVHATTNGSIPSGKQQEATRTTVIEAMATLEAVARVARSIVDKTKLWREWSKQVRDAMGC